MPESAATTSPRGRVLVRREAGLYAYERALGRAGLTPVAGADEAGRGACAGPLVVAAVVLPPGRSGEVPELADSKLLSPAARERVYAEVLARAAAWSVVVVEAADLDRGGLHRCNIAGMRRSLARLDPAPAYVLTDGFPVSGIAVPGLAVWKGDRVSASIAAASVLAKVTRDRIMVAMHDRWPVYDFATHKGYVTPQHRRALREHGPCPEHRRCFITVRDVTVRDVTVRDVTIGDVSVRDVTDRDVEDSLGSWFPEPMFPVPMSADCEPIGMREVDP